MRKKVLLLLSVLLVFMTTTAFSALSQSLTITSEVRFRVLVDIRVNGVALNSATNGATIGYESDYSKNTVSNGFVLPNSDSSISYTVHIDNNGSVDYAIYDILKNSSDNGLQVAVSGYNIGDVIPHNSSLDLVLTYTTTNPSENVINVVDTFNFKRVYYVTFETNTSETIPYQLKYEGIPLTLTSTQPTKTGYTFSKWNTKSDGTGVNYTSGSSYTADEDKKLYALYTLDTYNITYVLDGGTNNSNNPSTYTYEDSDITLGDATKTGYTFKGWTGNGTTTPTKNLVLPHNSTGDKTFTANFKDETPPTIAVTSTDGSVDYLTTAHNVNVPYNASSTNVTFKINAQDDGSGVDTIEYAITNSSTAPSTGWVTGANGDISVNKNYGVYYIHVRATDSENNTTTVTTKATTLRLRVVYYDDYATSTSVSQTQYYIGTALTSRTPTAKNGYTFDGWYNSNALTTKVVNANTSYSPTTSIKLYGKWTAIEYDILYTLHNGINNANNPSKYTIETNDITLGDASKTLTFVGHYNATSGANAANGEVTIGANTTANQEFAGWTGNGTTTPTKNLVLPTGSTGNKSYEAHWTAVAPESLPTVTRTGYTCGWSTSSTGTTIQYDNSGNKNFPASAITENSPATINLYAVCEPNTYTIAYTMNGGTTGTNAPTTGTFDSDVVVSKPSKTFTVNINGNGQNATVKNAQGTVVSNASSQQTFAGWTATDLDTATAKYGAAAHPTTSWNGTTKVGSSADPIYLLNLRSVSGTVTLKANWTAVNVTLPNLTKTGYQCKFNTKDDGTGTNYASGASYTPSTTTNSATLYVICTPNNYNIAYTLNGGTQGANAPTTGTYDQNVVISNPTKTVTITGNVNGTGATVGNPTSSTQTFAGWSSTSIGTTAQTGSTASNYASWNGTTKTKNTYFKNLADTNNTTVTMVANWTPVAITNGLPTLSKVGYNCKWYTEATGGSELGAGGAPYTPTANSADSITVFARCTERDDTAYRVNHYVHDLGTNTYTLDSHDDLTGTTNASLTVANLKKTISGFTYVDGYITGGTTKPTSGAVTTTTILPDGSRVINLYYRRNYLYVQYHVNGGSLATNHSSSISISSNLVSYQGNTNFLQGVYGSKVGEVNLTNYTVNTVGLMNYNNSNFINLEKTGYIGKTNEEWNTTNDGTGVSYSQDDATIDANGFAGADLTTGDAVVTLYVNWITVNYNISYGLNNGTVSTANPTTYTITTPDITLNNPTKTLTFKGNYNATSGANASSTDGITIGSNISATQTFKGWSGTGLTGETNTSVTIATGSTGNRSYTAHWTAVAPESLPTVTREGYTCGWSTTNTGTTIQYASGATNYSTDLITEDQASLVNLYAVCVPNVYEVTLNNQNATTAGTTKYYYQYNTVKTINNHPTYYYEDRDLTTPLNDGTYSGTENGVYITKPTRTGYSFNGYYTGTNGSGTQYINSAGYAINSLYKTIGDRTLYAKWIPNTYNINYVLKGGNDPSTKPATGTYDTDVVISNPTKTITITPNANNTGANIGSATSAAQTFAGWSSTVGSNAKTGSTASNYVSWNGSKTTNTYFKNLTDTNNGTVTMTANWTPVAVTLPSLDKTGYTCKWYTDPTNGTELGLGGSSYTPSANSNQAITAYARCTANTYTVTAKANGGSISSTSGWTGTGNTATKSVTYDQAYGTLPTVTRTGYTFKGWNGKNLFDETKYDELTEYQTIGSNLYKSAEIQLKPNTTYKISVIRSNGFDGTGKGYLLFSDQQVINNNWSSVAHNTAPNYTSSNYVYTTGADGILYIGYYQVTQANLDYIWENTDIQLEEGTTATPYEPYYISNITTVTRAGNHEINAIWEIIPYTITYALNNGTVATANPTGYNVETATFTLNNPTKTLTFKGNYNATSGANAASGQVTIGANTTAAQTFKGWSGTGLTGETNTTVTVSQGSTGNRTYTAHWTAVAPAKLPKVERTGYTCGWNSSSSGTTIEYASEATNYPTTAITEGQAATVNLYAVCVPNVYAITLNQQNGSGGTATIYEKYNTGYYLNNSNGTVSNQMTTSANGVTVPTRTGYTFAGYYTAANGGTQYIDSTGKLTSSASTTQFTAPGTLYAKWTKAVSSLTNTLSATNYIYNAAAQGPTVTVKDVNTTLTLNTDYSVSGNSNTNVGQYSVTITGKNVYNSTTKAYYTGTATLTYYINNARLTFNKGNCDSVSGTATLYTKKNDTKVYTGVRETTTTGTIPTASKTGYTFQGWYTDNNGGGNKVLTNANAFTGTAVTNFTSTNSWQTVADQTLYAHCTPNAYTVTANANGGSISSTTGWTGTGNTATKSVTYNSTYGTLPTVARAGYTFDGWYKPDKNGVSYKSILSNTTLRVSTESNYSSSTDVYQAGDILEFDITVAGTTISSADLNDINITGSYTITGGTNIKGSVVINNQMDVIHGTVYYHFLDINLAAAPTSYTVNKLTLTKYNSEVTASSTMSIPNDHTIYALWVDDIAPTKPTVALKHTADDTTYTSDTWTNKQVYTTITSTEAGSGVTEIYYSLNNSTWTKLNLGKSNGVQHSGTSYYGSEVWNDTDGRNITIYFKTKDAAGNYSEVSDPVKIKYDKSGPTITASNITYGSNLSITLADAYSGVVGWQVTSSSTAPTSGWTSVTKTASTTVTKSGLVPGTYYVWSIDDVGNKNSKQVTVSTKPVTVTAGSSSRDWNGSALTNSTCTAGSNQLLSGHTVTCTMTSASTITVASTTIGTSASVNNVIDTVTIKDANNNNVTSYYNVTKANGTLTISYATPTISLTAKTANWTGNTIAANTATASPNSSPTMTYTYYTNNTCTTQTTTSHGASAAGGAPSIAGQYYVKASAAAVSQKTNAASSDCISHKINAATPTVSLTAKEATYTGSAIAANTATVSPNSNPTITYIYYTDSGCSTKTGTTVATGLAASAGAAPVVAGQYYVKASAAEVSGKTAAASSACVSHKITPKAVTVTAGSSSRAWNGSALTNSSCTANALGTGDAVTCAMTSASTITVASTTIGTSASVNNVINTVTIKKGTNDVSGSYTITKANGTLTISYATPTISLTAKTADWTGSAITANTASASPNSSPTFSYVYYTDSSCSTQTTTSHGASATGGAPSVAGQYYVKANAAAVSTKTNVASSACTSHKINAKTPTVSLTAKEATYTGSAIAANTATVSPNSNPTITYTYYTDSGCSTQTGTTVATGLAASAGAAPVVAGQYYVKANAAAVSGKTAAASSACTSHKITPKAVTVTAGSSSRAWNGSALTNSTCTANALGTGDAVTCAMTSASTITVASTTIGTSASQTNTINTVTIKKGSNDVTASYTVTKATGTLTISYATPTISLTAKTANWTGSAIAANTATASPNSSPTMTYTYYTNDTCTTQTTTSHGASAAGGAPSLVGNYYVKASAAAVSTKTNAAASGCIAHTITASTPTVSLTAKEATYTGAAIAANAATVSPNSNPTITYAYYTDSGCSTATTAANSGAATNGAAPVYAGQYYVKANAAAVSGKTAAASSACTSHKINKKAITVTAGSSSRAWNGSALTNSGCTASALGTGDSVTCTMTSGSTITVASTTIGTSASQTNTIDTVTVKKGTVDVSNSYTITKATGTLTISYATPTVTLTAKETAYTGSAISINAPTISPNSNPTLTYNYYTNSTCTTPTSTSNSGAAGTGKPPVYAGQYYAKVSAASVSTKTNAADSNCASLKITKITCPAPTGVSITTAGVVTWTAASGASSYQISIDNTSWTAATSGVNYKNTITAATGSRTVYVRSVCDEANYTSTSSANGTASVTVHSVSLTKGTGISAVSGAGNYISGSTAAIDATVTAGYTWANWTGTSTLTQKANNITVNGNKSYTANATANTYTVVYNGNGNTGGSTESSTHTYGVAKNLTSNGFTKDGYTFAGWATSASGAVAYSNGQSVSNLTTTNGGTVNLYAKWNQSTYTMTINPNGGTYNGTTSTSTKTMTYDATDNNDIGVPTYSGYTFQGWYTAQSGGSLIYGTNGKNVALPDYWDAAYDTGKWKKASNITIWARWSITDPGIPTITGGTTKIYGASATTLTCTENTSYPSGFTKYYEFGYATSSTGTPSSWVASSNNQYTISTTAGTEFVGTRYYKCRVHVGSGTVNSNNVVSTSSTTMTINNATITLSPGSGATACSTINGQSPAYVNTSMTGVYNSISGTGSGTIPTASKGGYTFSGFYDGNTQVINGSGQIVANVTGWTDNNKKWQITSDKTLTAKCSENSYTIGCALNNGTCTTSCPGTYTINSAAITLPTSCSKTLTFKGNYNSTNGANAASGSGVSIGANTTKAQTWTGWTGSNGETAQKTVTIPTGSTGNKSYTSRFTAVAGTLPTVSRTGYTCGWNASSSGTTRTWGSGGTYATTSITEGMATTVNVYAVCTPNTYTVSFSRNCPSGTGSGGQTANVTATYNAAMPAITATAPTCSYYTFGGWYDTSAASGGTQYYTAAGASARSWNKTAATTLYGRWTPVNYTISYNLNNCGTVSGTNPTSYNYASAAITLKNPSKTGYTFTGWTGSNGTTAQTTVTIPNHSNGNKSYTANCTINKYYIDVNAIIGGKSVGNTSGCGKVDVYINNSKVSSQVTDYYQQHNYGTTYKIQNITTSNGACSRSGLATTYSGTVGTSNVNIGVQWSVPTKNYSYTGGMQSYTVPVTGNYRLTVWGAQGNYGYGATHGGGYGGKSVGTVNSLAAGSVIYIGVGGGDTSTANGGYNGGGSGNYIAGDNGFGGGGGGATHMAKTQSALLRNTTPANVYIVAGGGGGSSEASYDHSTFRRGGSGGGTSGGNGAGGSYIGKGATQDNIGARGDSDCANAGFGYGGSSPYGSTTESTYAAGGGGAGWYGGGASSHSSGGTYSTASSGGGGSGRLSGMLAGGATTTAGQRSGAGYASVELTG